MLKRLLIAVSVLSLILAFTGTAFSSNDNGDLTLRKAVGYGSPAKASVKSEYQNLLPPTAHRLIPRHLVSDFGTAEPFGSDTVGCEEQDYTQYGTTSGYYAWTLGGGITDQMSMRYTILPFHGVNVVGTRVRVYGVFGNPQLVITVWADNGGIPGLLLKTESFTPTVGNNLYTFGLPANITNGGPYHISMGGSGAAADSFWVSSDDGLVGTGRGSYQIGGIWYPNTLIDFGGGAGAYDFNWRVLSEVCQYYSLCGIIIPDARGQYADFLPDGAWSDGSVLSGTGQKFKAVGPETLKVIRFRHTTGGAYGDTTNYLDAGTNGLRIRVWPDSAGYARLAAGSIVDFTYPGGKANLYPVTGNLGGVEALDIPVPGTPVMLGYYHITVELTSLNPLDGQLGFRFGQPGGPTGGGMVKFTPPGSLREWDNIAGNPLQERIH
jgi:hypothetical protein